MSEFNLIWRKYGLKENPYFNAPLTIDEGSIPLSKFVGREKEREELKRVIGMGGEIRFMVVGKPGVGKTSLLNFIRNEASQESFFTPIREIEINKSMSGNEFIILTLSAIYDEIKRQKLNIDVDLFERLAALYELTQFGELSNDLTNIIQLNKYKLTELFKEVVEEIVNPRFKGLLIHYDNLDNIDNLDDILDLFGDIRDFLMNKNVIFFFVGNEFLPNIINLKSRISQIFISPALEVDHLSIDNINELLDKRIEALKIEENISPKTPHTPEAIKLLYELHRGNIREILNSLSSCLLSTASSNTPIIITDNLLRDVLSAKAKRITNKLTPVEKEILSKMLGRDYLTPTELKELTGKSIQNISSKYLPKLVMVGAVKLRSIEGRNRIYEVTPDVKWLKLERTEEEKEKEKYENKKKIKDAIDKSLKEFI